MCDWIGIKRVTAPTALPVTVTDLTNNDYLKDIDFTSAAEVSLFTGRGGIISVATQAVEMFLNRKLMTQDWEITYNEPTDPVEFPYGQLQSVQSVKITQDDDTVSTESATKYHVETGDNGLLWLKSGYTWTTTTRWRNAFKVTFRCGYSAVEDIPPAIIRGIFEMITKLYESREGVELPERTKTLIHPWKIYSTL